MNTAKKPGTLRRLLSGSLRALDLSRRIIVNLVFVLVMLLIIGAIFGGGPDIKPRSVLVIAPRGEIVEEFSGDPMERALGKLMGEDIVEVRLRDLVRVLDAAAQDDRIERVLLRPDDIWGAGVASLDELRHAIARYKASGKELIAYADGMTQGQYYLAAAADEVYLHPEGALLLEGLSRFRSYYREGLQDKLGVDVHLFRVGEYKSAAEPYILDAAVRRIARGRPVLDERSVAALPR
jgi:protease-4